MKRPFMFITVMIMFAIGCATPPPKAKLPADFLLAGTSSEGDLKDITERKKAVYHALKERSGQSSIVIIYDASGSMVDKGGEKGQRKFEAAYQGLYHIGSLFGSEDEVKLLVFGSTKPFGLMKDGSVFHNDYHRAMEAAEDVRLVYSCAPGRFNRTEFYSSIKYLESEKAYKGDTPIGYAVLKAHEQLREAKNAKVILITDGQETGPQLSHVVSKDKNREIRLRKEFQNYDDITIGAETAIKGLVSDNINFSPIVYGLGSSSSDTAESNRIREYFRDLAAKSGSLYIEAMTPLELLNAFMDAELMSVRYGLYSSVDGKKQEAFSGRVGIPISAEEGSYTLGIHLPSPLEYPVELRPSEKNIYYFVTDGSGRITVKK